MPLQPRFLKCCLLLSCMLSAGRITAQAANPPLQTETAAAAGTKRIYNEAAKTWYGMYCASDTLYISIAVTDPVQQRKLVMNGLEVWIDPRGKKNKKTGILYPFNAINKREERRPEGNLPPPPAEDAPRLDPDRLPMLEKQVARLHEMRLTGFKEELNGVQNNFHPSGIRVSFSFVKDTLLCQAQLPLNTLIESPYVHSHWSVGLIEKGNPVSFYGGESLPPGGAGDGMMPPPGPPPGEEDGMRIFEDDIIWYRLPLQNAGIAEKAVAAESSGKYK